MNETAGGDAERGTLLTRDLGLEDLAEMARVHAAAFPEAAVTLLGPEAVRRYYLWQMEGPHDGHHIGVFQGDRLVGLCVAGTFRGATGGFVKRNAAHLIGRILLRPWLLAKGEFRTRLVAGLKALTRKTYEEPPPPPGQPPPPPSFGILAICTHPEVQGKGAGRCLMAAAEARAGELGYERMNLSVHPSNSQAVRFYRKQGWVPDAEGEAWSGQMYKDLTTPEGDSCPS